MKNFWTEKITNIYIQWNDEEPKALYRNIKGLFLSMGPELGTHTWADTEHSLTLEYHPENGFTYNFNNGPSQAWNWAESNGEWQDDGSFVIRLENEGDALVFGDCFTIFVKKSWKNGIVKLP